MSWRSAIVVVALTITACSDRYLGIDRASLDPAAQAWLDRAEAGNKQAQFELGVRYARGEGVLQDCPTARKLLRQASKQTGGKIWVYSPPVTEGGTGRVIAIDQGPVQPGLQTAQQELRALNRRGRC